MDAARGRRAARGGEGAASRCRCRSSPAAARRVAGDGSFGGRYARPDEEVLEVWRAGVEGVRALLESGWDARPPPPQEAHEVERRTRRRRRPPARRPSSSRRSPGRACATAPRRSAAPRRTSTPVSGSSASSRPSGLASTNAQKRYAALSPGALTAVDHRPPQRSAGDEVRQVLEMQDGVRVAQREVVRGRQVPREVRPEPDERARGSSARARDARAAAAARARAAPAPTRRPSTFWRKCAVSSLLSASVSSGVANTATRSSIAPTKHATRQRSTACAADDEVVRERQRRHERERVRLRRPRVRIHRATPMPSAGVAQW